MPITYLDTLTDKQLTENYNMCFSIVNSKKEFDKSYQDKAQAVLDVLLTYKRNKSNSQKDTFIAQLKTNLDTLDAALK